MTLAAPVVRGARLGRLGLAGACGALVLVFFLALFPYGRLRAPLEQAASQALGARVRIEQLRGGPFGLRLAGVEVRRPGAGAWSLEAVRVRPALALSWLRGVPALRVGAEAWGARLDGTARLDRQAPGFDGRVEALDPTALPPGLLPTEPPWVGALDADVDLTSDGAGARGRLAFEGQDGAVTLPGLPFALPYDRLEGALDLGSEGIAVEALDVEGPMLSARAGGRIGPGDPSRASLDLEVEVRRADPSVQQLLRGVGIRLDGTGTARVRIQGTMASPIVRPGRG